MEEVAETNDVIGAGCFTHLSIDINYSGSGK